jgi:uncharacterized protein
MWGSEGSFTLRNAQEDVSSALDFLGGERARSEFRVDAGRIVLVGHSFGGWLALTSAAALPQVRCIAALTPANMGVFGESWRTDAAVRAAWTASLRQVVEGDRAPVRTADGAAELVAYLAENAAAYDARSAVGELRNRPLLLLGARADRETPLPDHHVPILDALRAAGASRLTDVVLPTDHAFTGRRDLLASTLVGWLLHECLAGSS